MRRVYAYCDSYDPANGARGPLDTYHTKQHTHCAQQGAYAQEQCYPSHPLHCDFRPRTHGLPIKVSIWAARGISISWIKSVERITYTTRYESGCLLNSFEARSGPSCFGLSTGGARLACETAFGLKPLSSGLTKVYFEGWS